MYREEHGELAAWIEKRRAAKRLEQAALACEQKLAALRVRQDEQHSIGSEDVESVGRSALRGLLTKLRSVWRARRRLVPRERSLARTRSTERIEQTAAQLARLQREREALGDVERGYQEAFERKLHALTSATGPEATAVRQLTHALADARRRHRSLMQAIQFGKAAVTRLDAALRAVTRHRRPARFSRRVHLDPVAEHLRRAQFRLRQFQDELSHAGSPIPSAPNLAGPQPLRPTDVDQLTSDGIRRRRTRDLHRTVSRLRSRTAQALRDLHGEVAALDRRIGGLDQSLVDVVHGR